MVADDPVFGAPYPRPHQPRGGDGPRGEPPNQGSGGRAPDLPPASRRYDQTGLGWKDANESQFRTDLVDALRRIADAQERIAHFMEFDHNEKMNKLFSGAD